MAIAKSIKFCIQHERKRATKNIVAKKFDKFLSTQTVHIYPVRI